MKNLTFIKNLIYIPHEQKKCKNKGARLLKSVRYFVYTLLPAFTGLNSFLVVVALRNKYNRNNTDNRSNGGIISICLGIK